MIRRGNSGQPENEQVTFLYPDFIPPEEGYPTSIEFEIVNTSNERGRGLKCKLAFRQGERVARLSGIVLNHTTLNTIRISPSLFFSDPWFCRFFLHSCGPNITIDLPALEVRALRDIQPGEYLTIDCVAADEVLTSYVRP